MAHLKTLLIGVFWVFMAIVVLIATYETLVNYPITCMSLLFLGVCYCVGAMMFKDNNG